LFANKLGADRAHKIAYRLKHNRRK